MPGIFRAPARTVHVVIRPYAPAQLIRRVCVGGLFACLLLLTLLACAPALAANSGAQNGHGMHVASFRGRVDRTLLKTPQTAAPDTQPESAAAAPVAAAPAALPAPPPPSSPAPPARKLPVQSSLYSTSEGRYGFSFNRSTAPAFGMRSTLDTDRLLSVTSRSKTRAGHKRLASSLDPNLAYSLNSRSRSSAFAANLYNLHPSHVETGEAFTLSGASTRNADIFREGLAVSPRLSGGWQNDPDERRPRLDERFARVLDDDPNSFNARLYDERETAVVGIGLDGGFRTESGDSWNFKATYGLDARTKVGDQTLYGGVEWRF